MSVWVLRRSGIVGENFLSNNLKSNLDFYPLSVKFSNTRTGSKMLSLIWISISQLLPVKCLTEMSPGLEWKWFTTDTVCLLANFHNFNVLIDWRTFHYLIISVYALAVPVNETNDWNDEDLLQPSSVGRVRVTAGDWHLTSQLQQLVQSQHWPEPPPPPPPQSL